MTFSMASTSFLPQYWAISTEAPEVTPKKISVMINWICPARDAPDNTVSPTLPSRIISVAVTPTLIRFCSAMGKMSDAAFL